MVSRRHLLWSHTHMRIYKVIFYQRLHLYSSQVAVICLLEAWVIFDTHGFCMNKMNDLFDAFKFHNPPPSDLKHLSSWVHRTIDGTTLNQSTRGVCTAQCFIIGSRYLHLAYITIRHTYQPPAFLVNAPYSNVSSKFNVSVIESSFVVLMDIWQFCFVPGLCRASSE